LGGNNLKLCQCYRIYGNSANPKRSDIDFVINGARTRVLSVDLINIGIYEINVDLILLDGSATISYTLTDQSLSPITVIPLNQIILLDITENTVQIISESGKLFEFML